MKRILGIDPGFATIGFGLIQAERGSVQMLRYGAITTPAGMPFPQRLNQIYEDMNELLKLAKPDAVSIEELFFNTNITTGIQVAHGRGVILYTAEKLGIPIVEAADYMENHPLGRTEWIKLYGILFGEEDRACSYYDRQLKELESVMDMENTSNKMMISFSEFLKILY